MRRKLVLFMIAFLGFSFMSISQSITSRTLLNNLKPYWLFLEDIRQDIEKTTGNKYESVLEQSYEFIQLDLRDSSQQLYLRIIYKIELPGKLIRYDFYCADKKISTRMESNADKLVGAFTWDSIPENIFELSTKQIEYIQIADRIASLGNDSHLSAKPSDYKSVIITSDFIKLDQSNHWNSRSLDKDSYYLRDLQFIIPLKENINNKDSRKTSENYYIGDMEIIFSDGSAKSHKDIGDKIKAQIDIEIKKYKEPLDNKK